MDELERLRRLRADVPPPDPDVLAGARAQLLDEPAATFTADAPAGRRRIALSLAAAAAVAATAVALASVSGPAHPPGPARTQQHTGRQSAIAPPAPEQTHQRAVPRYLHVTVHSWDISEAAFADRQVWLLLENRSQTFVPRDVARRWYWDDESAIGYRFLSSSDEAYVRANHPELITPGRTVTSGKDGRPARAGAVRITCQGGCDALTSGWDSPTPEWIAALPRDPDALRASLYRAADHLAQQAVAYGKTDDPDSQAFEYVASLLAEGYLPADLQRVLYQVLTSIPGTTRIDSARVLDGRTGVALAHLDALRDARTEVVFDAPGGSYLGARTVVVDPHWARDNGTTSSAGPLPTTRVPVGTVISSSAVTLDRVNAPDLPR